MGIYVFMVQEKLRFILADRIFINGNFNNRQQMNRTYQIKVDQVNGRMIDNLLTNMADIAKRWQTKLKLPQELKLIQIFPSVRVFSGPSSNIKIIVVFRLFQQAQKSTLFFFVSINIVDMDADLLQSQNIFEAVEPLETKIRNVAVHPNGRQVIILSEVKMHRYLLKEVIEDYRTFQLILLNEKSFHPTSYDDLQYHPSGKYLVGIQQDKSDPKNIQLRPFKLDAVTLEFSRGQNVRDKCISMQAGRYQFLTKWIIAIDKNQPSKAVIGFRMNTVCLWDLDSKNFTIQLKKLDINSSEYQNKSPLSIVNTINPDILIAGLSYLNSTKEGYLVGFDANRNQAFLLSKPNKTQKDSFVFSPRPNEYQSVKCIDIDDINSYACFRRNLHGVSINKLDIANNQTVNLYVDDTLSTNGGTVFRVEDIFYYDKFSEICRIFNQGINCFQIYTKCFPKKPYTLIHECQIACQKVDSNSFWNPVSMSCQKCRPSCKCSHPQRTFSPYYQSCVLDCSKIPYASPTSIYAKNTKCICQPPYEWFDEQKQCRVNCTKVQYSLKLQDLTGLQIGECACPPNFIYHPKLNSYDIAGECILRCQNGKSPLLNHNFQPYCECETDHSWDQNRYQCIKNKQEKKPFPGWAIALIVAGILIVLTIVAFFVRKRILTNRKRQEEKKKKEAAGDAAQNNEPSHPSDRKFSNNHLCVICNHEQNQANCKAPCGHYFHYFCIKQKIDEGQVYCPQCFKVFHHGVADLQFVEANQEIITISDN